MRGGRRSSSRDDTVMLKDKRGMDRPHENYKVHAGISLDGAKSKIPTCLT